MEKAFKYYFSLVTGEIVKILADEVAILENYQIPLRKKPNTCKKCYNRCYSKYDDFNQAYIPCKCVTNAIDNDAYKGTEISFYIPK